MKKFSELNDEFYKFLRQALDGFHDPLELGRTSPLATPYFLGRSLLGPNLQLPSVLVRGQVLQQLLQEAKNSLEKSLPVEFLEDGSTCKPRIIRAMELRFFQEDQPPKNKMPDMINVSSPTFAREIEKGINQLGDLLLANLKPALGGHDLPVMEGSLSGRNVELDDCLAALQAGHMVQITGPSGIGKTALGITAVQKLGQQSTLWFTIHLGLNDRLDTFLFVLGSFLHAHGQSNLWNHLLFNSSQSQATFDSKILLELLRYDLHQLEGVTPILVIDEIDLLQPSEVDTHAQFLIFLESIRESMALLLIGQHTSPIKIAAGDVLIRLDGLTPPEIAQLLLPNKISLSEDGLNHLADYTAGNPRLLTLLIALHQSGDTFQTTIDSLAGQLTVESLLRIILRRLTEQERDILLELSVYRRSVPLDTWQKRTQNLIEELIERQLVRRDRQGGVAVQLAYREILYQQLQLEEQEMLHQKAVDIRLGNGENTSAIYHAIQAKEFRMAINLWKMHSAREMSQGQASTALRLFEQISRNQLNDQEDKDSLDWIRAELTYFLTGNHNSISHLNPEFRPIGALTTNRQNELAGTIAVTREDFDLAIKFYEDGLKSVKYLLKREAHLHRELGWAYHRRRWPNDHQKAWRECLIARHKVVRLQGRIRSDQGDFAEAEAYFLEALSLAEELNDTIAQADSSEQLGELYGRRGCFENALDYCNQAVELNRKIGRLQSVAIGQANIATTYLQARQYEEAIRAGQEALYLSQRIENIWCISLCVQTLAEANLALGNLVNAEHFIKLVLQTEQNDAIPDALRVLGEIELKRGNSPQAQEYIEESIRLAVENQDPFLEAYGWRALGQVHQARQDEAQHDKAKAKECFTKAIALFDEMSLVNEIEKTQALVGNS